MSGSASILSLAGVAVTGVSAAAAATLARRERTYLPRGHASRIDSCRDPLGRALRYGCSGLTIGVEVGPDGRLRLTSGVEAGRRTLLGQAAAAGQDPAAPGRAGGATVDRPTVDRLAPDRPTSDRPTSDRLNSEPGRSFAHLVLDPLLTRVRIRGRLHRAQLQPFTVVLEPAEGTSAAGVLDALEDELAGYADMLTRCHAGTVRHAAVLVALAGAAREFLSARDSRLFFAEGTLADVERRVPAAVVPLVGEHVAWRLGWDGRGEMPGEERHLLRALIATAHAEGKRVRLFGVPEKRRGVRRAFWGELHAAGADLIGARDVGSLRRFLRAQRAHR